MSNQQSDNVDWLIGQIATLTTSLKKAKDDYADCCQGRAYLDEQVMKLTADNLVLRNNLQRYGRHFLSCPKRVVHLERKCDCGLDKVLSSPSHSLKLKAVVDSAKLDLQDEDSCLETHKLCEHMVRTRIALAELDESLGILKAGGG